MTWPVNPVNAQPPGAVNPRGSRTHRLTAVDFAGQAPLIAGVIDASDYLVVRRPVIACCVSVSYVGREDGLS